MWETFTFYYGRLTGHRMVDSRGTTWEILPVNGRPHRLEVRENGEWIGETFGSVEEAKAWISA